MKLAEPLKRFFKKAGEMFLDQNNGTDPKLIWGTILMMNAIAYLWAHAPGQDVWITVGGLITFGLLCYGISVKGDRDLITNGMKGEINGSTSDGVKSEPIGFQDEHESGLAGTPGAVDPQ